MRCADALLHALIRAGGLVALASLLLVIVVLVVRSLPLLRTASVSESLSLAGVRYLAAGIPTFTPSGTETEWGQGTPDHLWGLTSEGRLEIRELNSGLVVATLSLPDAPVTEASITATCVAPSGDILALGFADGSLQVISLAPSPAADAPLQLHSLAKSPIADAPIQHVDMLRRKDGTLQALAVAGNRAWLASLSSNASDNDSWQAISEAVFRQRSAKGPLGAMLLSDSEQALLVWESGIVDRLDFALEPPGCVESEGTLLADAELTVARPATGHRSLLCGTSAGELIVWSLGPPKPTIANRVQRSDRLLTTHRLTLGTQPIAALTVANRERVAIALDGSGRMTIVHITSDHQLLTRSLASTDVRHIQLQGQRLIMLGDQHLVLATLDANHPQINGRGTLAKLWYEGNAAPSYDWRPNVVDDHELHLSLMPLVFGSLKAAVLAILFSLPVGVLAAIYTSEFLPAATRNRIKPTLEMMASLPSVVVGYMAATIAAPFLESNLLALLLTLMLYPLVLILAAKAWCWLPPALQSSNVNLRLYSMLACFPLSFLVSGLLASPLQSALYDGNFVAWLGSSQGSAVGGWLLVSLPLALILSAIAYAVRFASTANNQIEPTAKAVSQSILLTCLKVVVIVAACYAFSSLLGGLGLDIRDSWPRGYQAQNSLLLGLALGFCLIPIIFTLTHDAIQAVPRGLREASFACGATRLQTTMRVVLPLAMSGIFGATLVSFSRAAGETMLVLTVVGNTPLMTWNPFAGLQSLSVALVSELPSAGPAQTHFHALMLGALVLFVFTFVLNSIGDWGRFRFRKRIQDL